MLKSIVFSSLALGCILLTSRFSRGLDLFSLGLLSIYFFICAGVELVKSINETRAAYWTEIQDFIKALNLLSPEDRAILGFKYPSIRLKIHRGRLVEFIEDTTIQKYHFIVFLSMSSDRFTSSRRDWNTTERPRRVYDEIIKHLEDEGYIYLDSSAGPFSWAWIGNAKNHLSAYYWTRNAPNMNALTPPGLNRGGEEYNNFEDETGEEVLT